MASQISLRRYTNVDLHKGTDVSEIHPEFKGDRKACERYAEKEGFRWKPTADHLFGGYFVADNGDCLMPT